MRRFGLMLLLAVVCVSSKAAIILETQDLNATQYLSLGPTPVGDQAIVASFTTSMPYSDVSIFASLFNFLPVASIASASLATQIGPGATTATQVAQSSLFVLPGAYQFELFHLPALSPGTYHLVLFTSDPDADFGWLSSTAASVIAAPGASEAGYGYANSGFNPATSVNRAYLPGSTFASFDDRNNRVLFAVEGTATGVPEPGTAMMIPGLIALLAALRLKRSK